MEVVSYFFPISTQNLFFKSSLYSTGGVILCIIIENVQQFIGHCLIPLNPWTQTGNNNNRRNLPQLRLPDKGHSNKLLLVCKTLMNIPNYVEK